jgi:hypothetical protein
MRRGERRQCSVSMPSVHSLGGFFQEPGDGLSELVAV